MNATALAHVPAAQPTAPLTEPAFPRCALITNLCPPYRRPIFDMLQDRLGVDVYLFGAGDQHFWDSRALESASGGLATSPLGQILRSVADKRYDVVIKCINGALALPMVYWTVRRIHSSLVLWTGLWRHPRTLKHLAGYMFTRHIYTHADAVCVYGNHVRDYLESKGVDAERLFVVGQPVPDPSPGRAYPVPPPEEPLFLFVGRFVKEKGLECLVDAFAGVPEPARLVLVGKGTIEGSLKERTCRNGIERRVVFAGPATGRDLADHYRSATALVIPSITTRRFREPWGLVANEAMSLGTPVIATNAVGAAAGGFVEDQITGLVVPERSPAALAEAMRSLVDEPGLRSRLAWASKNRATRMTYESMFESFRTAILYAHAARRN